MVFALADDPNGQEKPPPDEPARILNIGNIFATEMNDAAKRGEGWLRNAHAKQHACVRARFNVSRSLSSDLSQGIFVPGASYPAFLRYSNGAGRGFVNLSPNKSDVLPDNRGLGLKFFLPQGTAQDFLLTTDRNGFLPDAETAEGFFKSVSRGPVVLAAWLLVHPTVAKNLALLGLNGITTNLLKTVFWQQVPSRYGARAAKFMLQPCSDNSKLPDGPKGLKNFLADNLYNNLQGSARACYTFLVQFYESDSSTPIEDSTVQWNTPWSSVGTLEIESFASRWSFGQNQMAFCDYMSFNPWHAVPEHQPLGSLNRIRQRVYTDDASRRHLLRGKLDAEVTVRDWDRFPDL